MRHVLTTEEQLRGIRKAIGSSKTPEHLRKYLVQRREELAQKLSIQRARNKKRRVRKDAPGILDWLGF